MLVQYVDKIKKKSDVRGQCLKIGRLCLIFGHWKFLDKFINN